MQLDALDLRILAELQQDSSLTNVELAKRVHLSPSPCLMRVKALEHTGVIQRYVALADPKALGLGLNVFINISLKEQARESLAEFERRIAEHDEVMECYLMTGDSDYLIRVAVADIGALEKFILNQLTPIPGIEKIRSSFAETGQVQDGAAAAHGRPALTEARARAGSSRGAGPAPARRGHQPIWICFFSCDASWCARWIACCTCGSTLPALRQACIARSPACSS